MSSPVSSIAKKPSKVSKLSKKPLSTQSLNSTTKSPNKKPKTIEQIYQKKTQLEHILLRPDSYIGSTEYITTNLWVFNDSLGMNFKQISYVPGLYKIFDEIIVNAADNKVRDPSMDMIKVSIDRENNTISVYNNGRGIPVEMHAKENIYVPELIFGHLLTSSNYDDDEKKVTGGRNGFGAKLCNIFSTEFIVETCDMKSGKKFKQVYSENMSKRSTPDIKPNSKQDQYTKITFKPDLKRFHMTEIDDDLESLLKKRVYDLAGCCRGVKVFLNDTRIKIKDFKEYVDLYIKSSNIDNESGLTSNKTVVYETDKGRWEVAFIVSDGQFQQVSFVNSICTTKGGTHVNYIADQISANLIEAVKKKDKKGVPVKPFQVKNHMWLFVNALIENPTFDSQTKDTMTLRASGFGSKFSISEDFMKKVMKSGVVDNILKFVHFKENQMLKKTDGAKKIRISGISKLDDANNAGTKNASKCTLILTEGDSAKSLAVSGLSVVGRDNFGVFPLRGKLLNVREAAPSQISANAEINAIKQILGLQHGKVYTNADSLRYGHLMIMTDQDHDGSHIKGLIINLVDHFWPSLLKIPGFLLEFITPIVKVTKGKGNNKQEVSFFTIPEYENWKHANHDGKGWIIKYYKGLGTSTTEDAKKYFSDMNKHLKPFSACEPEERLLVDMAFNKKKADDRKEWLRQFQPGTFMDHLVDEIPISDFINKELILFSMADNIRSIPSVMDGFKPGQRKILFSCFKRNLKAEIKVAQLAGYVSEHSAYHHGEVSLCSTIINMAQTYVASNNLTFLEPLGQFGTRLQGGKDAASPRYVFTNLSAFARTVFHPSDDALLKTLTDDGQSIEPEWYLPILPMVLINGADGIGTGWSSSIPNYNPRDIVQNIHRFMRGEELVEMHPWYRGFKGTIQLIGKDKYKITGIINKIDDTTVEITELPLKTWTQNYKEQLEEWLNGTEKQAAWIKDFKEYHTDSSVHFVVTMSESAMIAAEKEGLENKFKLTSQISTTNMVCFDKQCRIRKYSDVNSILAEFCDVRKEFYQKRKEHLLQQLSVELSRLENKVRFVTEIINGKLVVQNRKRAIVIEELKNRGYEPMYKLKVVDHDAIEEDNASVEKDHGYDYLMTMPIWSLTMEKVEALNRDKQTKEAEVKFLIGQSIYDLWRTDLDAFLVQWEHFENTLSEEQNNGPIPGISKKGITLKKPKAKKKLDSGSSMDDESEDFKPTKKKIIKPAVIKICDINSQVTKVKPISPMKIVSDSLSSIKLDEESTSRSSGSTVVKKRVLAGKKTEQTKMTQFVKAPVTKTLKVKSDDSETEEEFVKKPKIGKSSVKRVIEESDDDSTAISKVKMNSKKSVVLGSSEQDDTSSITRLKKPVKKSIVSESDDDLAIIKQPVISRTARVAATKKKAVINISDSEEEEEEISEESEDSFNSEEESDY